ncbi:MAG: DUF3649 domain-containing protein, partial [Thiotrichales bacterium]|nr:DUF3649 domain-containing protein [Thiotrichales bacterium]
SSTNFSMPVPETDARTRKPRGAVKAGFAAMPRGGDFVPVAARVAAAVFGGYALAVVTAVGLAGILPMSRGDAVMTGLLSSFLFYCIAAIYAFSARSARRAWIGILGWTAVLGGIALATNGAGA